MRSFAIIAAAAGVVSAQYGVITQISDGQIQNPATSLPAYTPSTVVLPTGYTPGPVYNTTFAGTGASSYVAPTSAPYANSTIVTVTSAVGTGSTPVQSVPAESTTALATGAASSVQAGAFGFAAALAALFLA